MTLVLSVDWLMGKDTKAATKQLDDVLSKNGIGNTRKHAGMTGTVYT